MVKEIKHILILSSWYPNRNAPFLGNFVQRQAELLSKSFKVTVLHTVSEETLSRIECSIKEEGNLKEIIIYHPKGNNFIARRKEQDRAFKSGLAEIKEVDLIHAHVILPKGYLFVRAKKKYNCPLVVTEHGSYYRKNRPRKWTLKEKFILKYTKKHIDQLIAVSDFQKKDLTNYFEQQIQVISNPINTDLFIPIEKRVSTIKHFLHVSTLDQEVKNVKGIIDAVELLKAKGYTDFKLTIISDEPYDELKSYSAIKNTDSYIDFFGPCKPEELVPFYQSSDAFVLFSNYETFSIVLAEALSCGKPVITTPVGIGYDLPEEIGISVKINDNLSLAMAMEKIINGFLFDSEEIRKHALDFSETRVLHQLMELYAKLNG